MYLSTVLVPVMSSKRIEYPTSSPSSTSSSSDTRFDTLIAATRRGWVHAMSLRPRLTPASSMSDGICVVFPLPVSPTSTMVWFFLTIAMKSSLCSHTGSFCRCARIS